MPKRKYGSQYSATNFVEQSPEVTTIFNEFGFVVGSDDSIYHKYLQYALLAINGKVQQTIFAAEYMTNSMEALMKALRNEIETGSGEQDGADRDRDSKWSSEQVRRVLKIKPNHLESPEANMYFGINGLEKYFYFDVNNLSKLRRGKSIYNFF